MQNLPEKIAFVLFTSLAALSIGLLVGPMAAHAFFTDQYFAGWAFLIFGAGLLYLLVWFFNWMLLKGGE